MADDSDIRTRIETVVKKEFSQNHSVTFDDDAPVDVVRFSIEDASGNIVTNSHPYFLRAKTHEWSDEDLRTVIRSLVFGHWKLELRH